MAFALAAYGAASSAAGTSSTSVTADVVGATSLSTTGCQPRVLGRTNLGLIPVGTPVKSTDDCTVTFGSSNHTAILRMAQLDGTGMAMAAAPDRRQTSWAANGEAQVLGIPGLAQGAGAAMVVQPDGKVVVAGRLGGSPMGFDDRSVVYRMRIDGTLDTSFNSPNGYVAFNIATGQSETFKAVALEADGDIVAVGTVRTGGTGQDATIARINDDGTPDLPFGGSGTAVRVEDLGAASGGSNEAFNAVLVEPDGTLLVGGTEAVGTRRWVLQRFLDTGLPDPGFGDAASRVWFDPTGNDDELYTVVRDPRGGYFIGGEGHPFLYEAYVGRVRPDFSLDTDWGASGWRRYGSGTAYPKVVEIEPLPDGSAIVALSERDFAKVLRLTPNGTIDTVDFAAPTGIAVIPKTSTYASAQSIELTPTGNIYVLVQEFTDGIRLARLTPSGVLDTTFGTNGVAAQDVGYQQLFPRSLVLQGNSLLFGAAHGSSNPNDRLLRYGGPEIDDYATGGSDDRDWSSGSTTSMFGVCVREQLDAEDDWPEDPGKDCAMTDGDLWRLVPKLTTDLEAQVAHTTVAGQTATTRMVFGFRPTYNQPAGAYEAPILLEVVSPSV